MGNKELIAAFYEAFQRKDYALMQQCYAPEAVFNDEIFRNLNGTEAGKMWEMLLKRGKDMQLEFRILEEKGSLVIAEWVAVYTFSQSGRKVVNRIRAEFEVEGAKIRRHTDQFDFPKWARQALGTTGLLLGWTPFFKKKIQDSARQGLQAFMAAHTHA